MYLNLKPNQSLKKITLIIGVAIMLASCAGKKENNNHAQELENLPLKEAKGFSIGMHPDFTFLTVRDPWQGAKDVAYHYVLAKDPQKVPEAYRQYPVIQIPLDTVICMSTTHVGFLDKIDELESIAGLSGMRFVTTPALVKRIEADQVREVGYENSLNYELMAGMSPNLVFTYGVGSNVASYNQKLNELGIPTVFVAEYLENTPLGRAEWLLFMAAFYDKLPEARNQFDKIAQAYNQLRSKVDTMKHKPQVITGFPYKDTWYIPGGKSFMAKLIKDAGGTFLWSDNTERKSQALGIESVFERAWDAEVWINLGAANKKEDILAYDNRFKEFPPFQHARVFNNNAVQSKDGGSAFWEQGTTEPQVLLKELIQIFHPGAMQQESFYYYKKLQ